MSYFNLITYPLLSVSTGFIAIILLAIIALGDV